MNFSLISRVLAQPLFKLNRGFGNIHISNFSGYIPVVHPDGNAVTRVGEAVTHHVNPVVDYRVIEIHLLTKDVGKDFPGFENAGIL